MSFSVTDIPRFHDPGVLPIIWPDINGAIVSPAAASLCRAMVVPCGNASPMMALIRNCRLLGGKGDGSSIASHVNSRVALLIGTVWRRERFATKRCCAAAEKL